MAELLLLGSLAGLLIGVVVRSDKAGCIVLLFVPVLAVLSTAVEQRMYPDRLTAFSGLDFLSDPFWFSLGALCGLIVGRIARAQLRG
ncbi:hypothetical protein [Sphingomonas hengshuiensis]|nr:hypothetical protein [Sphingomonas hengshuiensis]